jgi:cellulose synthase/poly-beta-1,6-N-acetylglucosamine synthase-like glycosyltransferase
MRTLFFFVALLLLSIYLLGVSATLFVTGLFSIILVISHTAIKLSSTIALDSTTSFKLDKNYRPLVSIHVACKDEPARIVNETIKALTKMNYENYEVIVINSNSQDKTNWTKIKNYVESCGKNYIFVHLDKVSGFKSGALNYLNDNYMNKKSKVIAIVDCDYIVEPNFLSKTVGYFNNPKVGIVQVPQDYYNLNKENIGLLYEYRSFFALVMHQAQRFNLVNFTGTMGLIRASLLINNSLKWNEWCITEDTEAGTHINSMGYRGVYIDESLGKGLMPYDYSSLARQRQRWVYGNTQIISKDLYYVMKNPVFSIKQKISFLAQLVTWYHFELLVVALYLLNSLCMLIIPTNDYILAANNLLAGSILISVVGNLAYFIIGMRKEASFINRLKAFLVHYGLIYVMSSGWLIYLIGYKLGFNVTNKENTNDRVSLKQLLREMTVSIMLILISIIKILSDNINSLDCITVSLFMIAELTGIIYLNRSLIKSK